jgi:hypothetical protein
MSIRRQLADAAREVSAKVARLPDDRRPDVAKRWDELLDRLDEATSEREEERVLAAWLDEVRAEIDPHLATRWPAAKWRHWVTAS